MIREILHSINLFCCNIYLRILNLFYTIRNFSTANEDKEKIILSMTSWPKRIDNVATVIRSILQGTLQPDKIVINLSLLEFPNKEKDLPQNLNTLIAEHGIEVNWLSDNTRTFKKWMPVIDKYPNDAIISIDDDMLYPPHFVETLYKKHKENPEHPIAANKEYFAGAKAHCGCASLVKKEHFGKWLNELYDSECVKITTDDIFYTFCAAMNNVTYIYAGELFYTNLEAFNPTNPFSANWTENLMKKMHYHLCRKVINKYHINMERLNAPIFVNPFRKNFDF